MTNKPLRGYQERAIELMRVQLRLGHRAVVLVVPTGGGKTRIGSEMVSRHVAKGGRVLWTAHRTELVAQARERLLDDGLPAVGVIAAGMEPDESAPVQVASIQTLASRGIRPTASLVVMDEAHHYVAEQWGEIADHYAEAFRVGLTATPERSDGRPLGDLFTALVAPIQVPELTEAGYLVPAEVLAPHRRLHRQLAGDPVDRYLEVASGRRALFFAATVAHAAELAASLNGRGVPAVCIHADTPPKDRADAISRFRSGEILALTNVFVFTEGTDLPEAEVCVLARGFSHPSTYLQCVGRILRPSPGKISALVLDLMGVSRSFGIPSDFRTYSLDGRAIAVVDKEAEEERGYGSDGPVVPTIIETELDIVREISAIAEKWTRGLIGPERYELEHLLRIARKRGFKPGWAAYRFREIYNRLPWESVY